MHETKKLEFKETITNTFLKTVSAFSNYDGGEIFFGIDDNGNVKGMPNIRQSCLDIENTIKIMLPVFEENMNLTEDERTIYKILSRTVLKSISEIAPYVSFGKSKTIQILKDLIQKGIVTAEGKGRGTKYIIK